MYIFKSQSYCPKYIQYIATMSGGQELTGSSPLVKNLKAINTQMNTSNINTGREILANRTSVAAQATALANQTGGNILGFTYE